MLVRLLLLFTLLPMVELALLIWIGNHTGLPAMIALVLFTGTLGAWLARHEGLRCLSEIHRRIGDGELPADALLDGLLILIAGAVLITPGVLTDLAGFAILAPPVRRVVRGYVARRIRAGIVVGPMPEAPNRDDVIDVEHRRPDGPQT